MVLTQERVILYLTIKIEADSMIDSKVIRGSPSLKIGSGGLGHAQLVVVLWSVPRRVPTSMSVPSLKRIAVFNQKL